MSTEIEYGIDDESLSLLKVCLCPKCCDGRIDLYNLAEAFPDLRIKMYLEDENGKIVPLTKPKD